MYGEPSSLLSSHVDVSLPTRVIDFGPLKKLKSIYIWESGSCWSIGSFEPLLGGSVIGSTTRENIAKRKQQLQCNGHAQNFQDAIKITRRLGCQYLWINSLCILQDSHSNWIHKSTQMAYIFQNAALTLAADGAENSSRVLILPMVNDIRTVRLPYRSTLANFHSNVYFRPYLEGGPHGPLRHRGWALQEEILSQRTLHFTDKQLMWECNSRSIS
jgi:hypothetical protein